MRTVAILLAALLLTPAVATADPWVFTEQPLPQPETYGQAYKQHLQTGKPLLVAVSATWCAQCRIDKRDVLTPMLDAGQLSSAIFIEIDQDKNRKLVAAIKAAAKVPPGQSKLLPCYVVFRRDSGKLSAVYHIGKISRADVLRMVRRAESEQ